MKTNIPEARIAHPPLRFSLLAFLSKVKRPFAILALISALGFGAWHLGVKVAAWDRQEEKENREACEAYNGVRLNNIARIKREVNATTIGWQIYIQNSTDPKINIGYNSCEAEFVADVPADQSMWAYQTAWYSHRSCQCAITFHVHSSQDIE